MSRSRFDLSREQGPAWWIWVVAALVHLPVGYFVIAMAWREASGFWPAPAPIDQTPIPNMTVIHFGMGKSTPAPPARAVKHPGGPPTPALPDTRNLQPTVRQSAIQPTPAPIGLPVVGAVSPTTGTNPTPVAVAGNATVIPPIAPAFGSGVLWGHAPKATAEQLAQRLLGTASGERLDSLTTVRLQQWIDSLAAEANARRPIGLTTTLGGKKVGVDGQWIYLGPIKIPAALLALLPINIQANPTQTEYNKRLSVMREDLYIAAQRAQNFAEFKSAVDKLRAEKQAEKEFRDNQRGGGGPEEERPGT